VDAHRNDQARGTPQGRQEPTALRGGAADDAIPFDELPRGASVEVWLFDAQTSIGGESVRPPHRHDYHELIWIRSGAGVHLLDGEEVEATRRTITVIGRGQIHQFQTATDLEGGVLRFSDEVLSGGEERIAQGWLLTGRGGRVVNVPEAECETVQRVFAAIADEAARPPDAYTVDLQRHRVSALVLLVERWYDQARAERRDADDADVQLHRRFAQRLEADFARHHDAAHYALALGLPASALSQALGRLTGRSTKELILERVMLEASRLLRFTDLAIGTIAHRVGFADQLYFSRAFKRHRGHAPQRYRAISRGG
jgi:AraC family transcriptional regulator, transcriptional activator of pobA